MPLSPSKARTRLHGRRLTIDGYEREDGLFDIEGHLVDAKTYAFDTDFRGHVSPGVPVHEMWIRLTIDESMTVREVETVTDFGPYAPCFDVPPNFKRLEGLKIGPGWTRAVRERVGGTEGCTHINEMLAQVATTAFQTMVKRWEEKRIAREAAGDSRPRQRPLMIGACHAFAADGPVVKAYWPEFYKGEKDAATDNDSVAEKA